MRGPPDLGSPDAVGPVRTVSLIAPMRNEARHVDRFVRDIAGQAFDGPLELFVADGESSDNSVELLRQAASRNGVSLTVVENPDRYVSQGLNRCIRASDGELVVRVDVHARYPPDYVRLCLEASNATGAANVGGVLEPCGETATERAVAAAMDSPFGGIGWTRRSRGREPFETDTVTFGAFRRAALEAVGGYDEALIRNQDDELNLRLRRNGWRVVLDPRIRVLYVPRGRTADVFTQYYEYGRWKVPVMRKHRVVLGARSLVPAAFVVSLAALLVAAPWSVLAAVALIAFAGSYLAAAAIFGTLALRRRRAPLTLLPRVVAAYGAFHLGYGVGMVRGLVS